MAPTTCGDDNPLVRIGASAASSPTPRHAHATCQRPAWVIVRSLLFAVGLTASLPCVGQAAAGGVAPTKPSQLVTLTLGGSPGCNVGSLVGRQLLPDSTGGPFSIPNGQVLIVTRFEFVEHGGTPSTNAEVALFAENPNINSDAPIVWRTAALDSHGDGSTTADLGAGYAVRPGIKVCVSAGGNAANRVLVRGFLAPDK